MSQTALVRARRTQSQEPTLKLLAFQIRHHWFCIPLAIARRVLPKQASSDGRDADLIQLQNENIPILNAAQLVYSADRPQLPSQTATTGAAVEPTAPLQNIIVVELSQGGSIGLIVDGVPILKRVRQSAFSPVPPMYLKVHQLRGISSIINPDPNLPDSFSHPMFLLVVEALLQWSDSPL